MSAVQGYPRFAAIEPLCTIAFVLDDKRPMSLNRTYGARAIQSRAGKWTAMMYMTPEADARKALLGQVALLGRQRQHRWPGDLWIPAHVRISMYPFNCKNDAASECKLVADAFEGVLYHDDKVVSIGEAPRPMQTGEQPRIEYIIDLLEERTPFAARTAEKAMLERRALRIQRDLRAARDPLLLVELAEVNGRIAACSEALRLLVKNGAVH